LLFFVGKHFCVAAEATIKAFPSLSARCSKESKPRRFARQISPRNGRLQKRKKSARRAEDSKRIVPRQFACRVSKRRWKRQNKGIGGCVRSDFGALREAAKQKKNKTTEKSHTSATRSVSAYNRKRIRGALNKSSHPGDQTKEEERRRRYK
jgi:hypothetical protein